MSIGTAVRRFVLLVCAAAAAISPSACSSYERHVRTSDEDYGSRLQGDPKEQGSRMYGSATRDPGQHENKFIEYSGLLSREVASMSGIDAGVVFLTDKNAYVGLTLQRGGLGTLKKRVKEQDFGGTGDGVYNFDTGSPYWDGAKLVTPYNSTLTVNDHNLLSNELKQAVALRIRTLAPRVEEVHVSANMDLVNELTEYAKEAWGGRPLQPWVSEFNTLVRYHFADGRVMPLPMQQLRQARDRNDAGGSAAAR